MCVGPRLISMRRSDNAGVGGGRQEPRQEGILVARPADDLADLYAVPLHEFIRVRGALAARLRKAGHTDQAAEVARLPKPTLPVWAVNQLARRDEVGLARLLRAAEAMRQAQLGRGDAEVGAAAREYSDAIAQLGQRAEAIVRDAGLKASRAIVDRITATLRGATADPTTREDLHRGRLRLEVPAQGFEVFAGTSPVARPRPAAAHPPPQDRREAARQAARDAKARARVMAAEATLRKRQQEAEALAERAATQQRAADEALSAAAAARQEVERAEAALREARAAVEKVTN